MSYSGRTLSIYFTVRHNENLTMILHITICEALLLFTPKLSKICLGPRGTTLEA